MSSFSATPPSAAVGGTTFSAVHPDIIKTQILARLDGPSLAAAACACSELHALVTSDDALWRDACASTWPSTADPRVRQLISAFPSGHRSFFSDSFPLVTSPVHLKAQAYYKWWRPRLLFKPTPTRHYPPPHPGPIISAVDIFHQSKRIFSRVHETDAPTGRSTCAPFRVSLAGHVPIPMRHGCIEEDESESWVCQLEERLTLSWIVIDPTRGRAANVSSLSPVSAQRQWPSGDVEVRFGTVMAERRCVVAVTCGGKEMEVSMQVEGVDGRVLNGRDSLVILHDAIENGERLRRRQGQDGKRMFEEYEETRTSRRRRRVQRIERELDLACVATGLTYILACCCFIFFTCTNYIL